MLLISLLCAALLKNSYAQNNPPAPVIWDNMPGTSYTATIDKGPGDVVGGFNFTNPTDQRGVRVSASLSGFNVTDENTYIYHIHQKLVPADGNCNNTGDHFDPYHAGASYPCNPDVPDLCQLGDLSGKHGALIFDGSAGTGSYAFTYFDDFLSTTVGTPSFFGNLSLVVHRKRDGYRLKCGNLHALESDLKNASGLAGGLPLPNSSITYNFPTASFTSITSVVATTTVFPSQLTSPPLTTSITAIQTLPPMQSVASSTSEYSRTLTGISIGSSASKFMILRGVSKFIGAIIIVNMVA